jgi:hypothetical protein
MAAQQADYHNSPFAPLLSLVVLVLGAVQQQHAKQRRSGTWLWKLPARTQATYQH